MSATDFCMLHTGGISGCAFRYNRMAAWCSRPAINVVARRSKYAGTMQPSGRNAAAPSTAQQHPTAKEEDADKLVQNILTKCQHSDRGVDMPADDQADINSKLQRLEEIGKRQSPRPLKSEDIWGNFNVVFTSIQNTKQQGQPAGGGFRSAFGRKIFQTTKLCQSIFKPDLVTNKVEFALFGFLMGYVGLRGRLEPLGSNDDTVKVKFAPPRLSLPGGIDLAIGPRSEVQLTTTFLNKEVRMGRGGRGSLFVFTKGGAADHAGMENVGLGKTTPGGWALLLVLLGVSGIAAQAMWNSAILGLRIAAFLPGVVAIGLVLAVTRTLTANPVPPQTT